jgi:hypothetical protein
LNAERDRAAWNLPRQPVGLKLVPAPDADDLDRDANVQPVLDWQGFLARYFPGRRRHDLEALTAYAAYKSSQRPDRSKESVRAPS